MMGPVTVLLSIDAQYLFVNLTKKLASMPSQMCYLNGEMQKKKKLASIFPSWEKKFFL